MQVRSELSAAVVFQLLRTHGDFTQSAAGVKVDFRIHQACRHLLQQLPPLPPKRTQTSVKEAANMHHAQLLCFSELQFALQEIHNLTVWQFGLQESTSACRKVTIWQIGLQECCNLAYRKVTISTGR